MLAEVVNDKNFKIKISNLNGSEVVIAVSCVEKKIGLPLLYYVFSKIIQEKVISLGVKLT